MEDEKESIAKQTGNLSANILTTGHTDRMVRFNGTQGHGYAAEQANNLADRLSGKDALVIGDDNARDGADRLVNEQYIQTKYNQTAQASVDAAFQKNGEKLYRYYDSTGKPMQLEVPADQYEEAVRRMEQHIRDGKVPSVTNPKEAKKLIRKGTIDYQTAKNIAKAGNVDSLIFDSKQGAVIAMNAFGISATITFAKALWDGKSREEAIEISIAAGIKTGGVAFASSVLSAQLTRTKLSKALMIPAKKIVRKMPSSVRKTMRDFLQQGSKAVFGEEASKDLAKLLRSNIITTGAVILVMSAGDIHHYFQGKISGKQLFKDVATLSVSTVAGIAGGAACGLILTPILGPGSIVVAVEFIGGGAIGAGAGKATHKVLNKFIEDDSVAMVRILDERLPLLAQQYLLNKEELDITLDELKRTLAQGKLLEMFASKNREAFADKLLTESIQHVICHRTIVTMPNFLESLTGFSYLVNRKTCLTHEKINPQALGEKLLGRKIPENAARKAWYVTKQANILGMEQEYCLQKMQQDEQTHGEHMQLLEQKKDDARQQFEQWLEN